jgi:LysM repeat protein
MPTLTVGAVSLLLLGFRYQHFWWGWVRNHVVASGGAAEQTLEPLEIVERAQAAKHLKTVEQPGVEGHPDSDAKPKVATSLSSHPVEVRSSLAPGAAAPAAAKSDVTGPATAPEMRIGPTAPAAATVSAGTQIQTGVPAAPKQRSQTIVKYGDTLEKIAIRYFGSNSGINELVKANPQLTNINQLSVGQIIYLPPGITAKASHDQTATARPVQNADDSPE